MIWASDKEGRVVHGEEEWTEITGQPVADGLGDGWQAMVHPDDLPKILPVFCAATRSKSPFTLRYRLRSPQGGFVWFMSGAVPSLGPPNDEFLGFLGSLTEIDADATPQEAGGWLGGLSLPQRREDTLARNALDLVADHLLMAHALIAGGEAREAILPPLRRAMLSVAIELARRSGAVVGTPH